ncbi:hypothetical protein FPOAC2_00417 [Fusarium poae]
MCLVSYEAFICLLHHNIQDYRSAGPYHNLVIPTVPCLPLRVSHIVSDGGGLSGVCPYVLLPTASAAGNGGGCGLWMTRCMRMVGQLSQFGLRLEADYDGVVG